MAIEFIIKSKVSNLVTSKGETVYYPWPKAKRLITTEDVIHRIVEATSLATGDVRNALVSLSEVVCDALRDGYSVDLAELGRIRVTVPSKLAKSPEDISVENSLKLPQVRFVPKKSMIRAARKVRLSIDSSKVIPARKTKG